MSHNQHTEPVGPDDPLWEFFNKNDPLCDLEPVSFANGATWTKFNYHCRLCDTDTLDSDTRGELRPSGADQYHLTIVAICRRCSMLNLMICEVGSNDNQGGETMIRDVTAQHSGRFNRGPVL